MGLLVHSIRTPPTPTPPPAYGHLRQPSPGKGEDSQHPLLILTDLTGLAEHSAAEMAKNEHCHHRGMPTAHTSTGGSA